jgi:DnaJ domain
VRTRDWATIDFYAVLGVEPTASSDDINLAFRGLAKRLHPDRVGDSSSEAEQFKLVTAAYDVLGSERLRRSYDQVRIEVAPRPDGGTVTSAVENGAAKPSAVARPLAPEVVRRNGRRWIAGGVAVSLIGILVATLIVHLQLDEHARRAGRVKTAAVLVVSPTRSDVRFTTATGQVVQVAEPARVNPGADNNGDQITVLYRPDRPTDVIIDESTAARDITLWIIVVKLLVGGPVFLGVGFRRLKQARARTRGAAVSA